MSRGIFMVVALFICFLSVADEISSETNDLLNLYDSVKAVDSISNARLGLSIRQIAVLLGQGSNSFQPRKSVEENGDYHELVSLQKEGFVILKIEKGLPDGTHHDEEFVNYIATNKGKIVISALTK